MIPSAFSRRLTLRFGLLRGHASCGLARPFALKALRNHCILLQLPLQGRESIISTTKESASEFALGVCEDYSPLSGMVGSNRPSSNGVRSALRCACGFVMDAVWHMSSTLKKRRAKMNKHKLRKRRKLERLKSK